jgi:hypothetical protein
MKQSSDTAERFAPVERYFHERSRLRGDLYGWGPVQLLPHPVARLVADPTALDLPAEIEGIEIVIMRVGPPEAL